MPILRKASSTAGLVALLSGAIGCTKTSTDVAESKNTSYVIEPAQGTEEPPTVIFDMKMVSGTVSQNGELYDCRYEARGKIAKFRLEFRQDGPPKGKDPPIAAAEGKFIAVPGSENSVLMEDLSKALEATHPVLTGKRQAELAFDAVVLGENQSLSPNSGYTNNPPGNWKLIKIFLPKDGDDEGEVFLNLNPVLGKGEFSIKDSDYGDYVVGELAKVL
jgi:hypothetical protein